MRPLQRAALSSFLLLFPLLFARPAAAQFAQITFPAAEDTVSGITLVSARQLMTSINPGQVGSVRFEYSSNAVSWNLIGVNNSAGNSGDTQSPLDWDILWDTSAVAPGTYQIRARFYLNNGLIFTSPAISITTSLPPVADMTATIGSSFVASFNGGSSTDPNPGGSIVAWDWDFGDGTIGVGPTTTHPYTPGGSYIVSLTVTNNRGTKNSTYREVLAFAPLPQIIAMIRCIAKDITLRGAGLTALGNDGKGAGWPAKARAHDGKTLGPLAGTPNPGNTDKKHTGFAFEILSNVEGIPLLCGEVQLIKATYLSAANEYTKAACEAGGGTYNAGTMICTLHSTWTGTSTDFDGDGTVDLDLSTKAKCETQGGTWDGTKCVKAPFPKAGTQYKPDEPTQDSYGYRKAFSYKAHAARQIIWWDAPRTIGHPNGFNANLDFVAIIRGTDGKYCYDSFNVQYEVGKANSETITENKKECNVDKTKVPGLK